MFKLKKLTVKQVRRLLAQIRQTTGVKNDKTKD